jgi:hypothetical protein
VLCADPADLHQAPPDWMRPREAMPSRPVVDVIFRTCDGEERTEMTKLSRREALRLGAVVAAVPPALALPPLAESAGAAEMPAAAAATPASWGVEPFANHQVRLGPSLFTANRDRILAFAEAYPADRIIAAARTDLQP